MKSKEVAKIDMTSAPKKSQQTVQNKFKMVNSLRMGLSKFDEVITPEVSKLKKAMLQIDKVNDNPSINSNHSKSGSGIGDQNDKKYVRVFKNDLGSQVDVTVHNEAPKVPQQVPKPEEEKKESKGGSVFGNYNFA